METKKTLSTLKPGDKVYARCVDAEDIDFKIRTLTVQSVCMEDATGHWTNNIVDVDWGHQGFEHGTFKYKKGFVVIDDYFPKHPNEVCYDVKYACIPINEHNENSSGAIIFTSDGIEIEINTDKNCFLKRFEKTVEIKKIDAARAESLYQKLKKELEKYTDKNISN